MLLRVRKVLILCEIQNKLEEHLSLKSNGKNLKICGLTGVIGTEPEDNITIVGHSNCVLSRRQVELPVKKTSSVQIKGML